MKYWKGMAIAMIITPAVGLGIPEALRGQFGDQQATNGATQLAIAVDRAGARLKITFNGILQSAEVLGGPWIDVPNAASPFEEQPVNAQRFYRSRDSGGIFASTSVAVLKATGPFQMYFDLAYAGIPDGIFPPRRDKPYFDGKINIAGLDIPVTMRVRGNSSLQECPFPKLKFKVSSEDRAGTPFFDAREVNVGTHCAEGGRGTIGRLRDETAAFREALAYEIMDLLGFITPRVRRARIEYHDTTATHGAGEVGWALTRSAVLLDDIEVVAERMGGRALEDEEVAQLKDANFDAQLITDLLCLHALLGNWDFALTQNGEGLWNTDVIELEPGKWVPIAGDFDLASWVTEIVRLSAPHDYHPELPDVERQALYALDQIQKRAGTPSLVAARDRFEAKRPAIEARISTALVDNAGRTNALHHLTAFFEALASTAP
jgi:hypothetical protein